MFKQLKGCHFHVKGKIKARMTKIKGMSLILFTKFL